MEETALKARVKHMCLVSRDVKFGCEIFRGSHAVQGEVHESDTLLILQAFPGYGCLMVKP